MIKPEELRIGNYVSYYGTPKIVESVHKNGINAGATTEFSGYSGYGVLEFDYEFKDLEPIPLTEELLVKAGFEKVINTGLFENISLDYWAKDALLLFTNGSEPKEAYLVGHGNGYFGKYFVTTGRWIYHLHDLQNVYHAWKGTELNIKL